ncbi:PorP/SprF family type IX secretion system membrane protein [Polaribacter sp. HL-MS24]|uniref:PorP/SprF family type IX secretion system membrane protein n=1 Tax=Polaribacter sp. HL-MS24 TaxID=3077735 RepID=UPI0029344AC4|nr:PorP/SprF family type IX secretion system membrane protein [Polaribacter sp. HL-MS24]WOC40798.1 PorP/SprF family type IX secretion system membrane protein [Polaribacter sp. HL-MS24]
MKKITILISLLTLVSVNLWSQQEGLISQYRQQMTLFNPAAVSIDGVSRLSVIHRRQWINIPSSPVSSSFSYGVYVGRNVGLGLSVVTDKVFIEQRTFVGIDYSYKIQLDALTNLYLGIKAGVDFYSLDTSGLNTYTPSYIDPSLNSMSHFATNIGIGAYITKGAFYVSLGIPRMLKTVRAKVTNNRVTSVRGLLHIYSAIGYDFVLHKVQDIHLKPSIFTRNVIGAPTSIDLNTMVRFMDRFEVGATVRSGGNYAGIAQVDITETMQFGWTYEVNSRSEMSSIGDSFEFILLYEF